MSPGPYDLRLVAALAEERLAAAQRVPTSHRKPRSVREPQPEVSSHRFPVPWHHRGVRTASQH